jgi:hypothetical protein
MKIRQNLLAEAYWAKSLGKSLYEGRNMPTVAPIIARITTVSGNQIPMTFHIEFQNLLFEEVINEI